MTVLQQIRHGGLALIAGFLVVVMIGPTESPSTLWKVDDPSHDGKSVPFLTPTSVTDPMLQASRASDTQLGKIRWRLSMAKHYADQEMRRLNIRQHDVAIGDQPNEQDAGVDDQPDEHAAGTGDSQMPITKLASYRDPHHETQEPDDPTKAVASTADLAAYNYWNKLHASAVELEHRFQVANQHSPKAVPIAQMPGQPSKATLIWAILAGMLALGIVVPLNWAAAQNFDPPESDEANRLHVPHHWFRRRPSSLQRMAKLARSACTVVVLLTIGLLLWRAIQHRDDPYPYTTRVTTYPLTELADLI